MNGGTNGIQCLAFLSSVTLLVQLDVVPLASGWINESLALAQGLLPNPFQGMGCKIEANDNHEWRCDN